VLITAYTARLVWSVRGPASELPISTPAEPAAATR
jgi:cytochrome c oxidase assembly protein subunit 15